MNTDQRQVSVGAERDRWIDRRGAPRGYAACNRCDEEEGSAAEVGIRTSMAWPDDARRRSGSRDCQHFALGDFPLRSRCCVLPDGHTRRAAVRELGGSQGGEDCEFELANAVRTTHHVRLLSGSRD
jgi:hypothetical protein